ncbi:MAG: AsmA family protein, partial [Gammaproteobacteria bacterium]|nr:AsmA family protein [Gammaproteobacteria bacterium]
MGRLLKLLLLLLVGVVGVIAIAAVSLFLFFDPNDFRDRIAAEVKESTGRDLVLGDVSLTLFPWLAVEVGPTELGNAEGFDDERFLAFEQASLSVKILPLILRQAVEVGAARLDGLEVNLQIDESGRTNWDDLATGDAGAQQPDAADESGASGDFHIASVGVTGANVSYADRQADSTFEVSGLSFESGRIVAEEPIDLRAEFDFTAAPGDLGGHITMRTNVTFSADLSHISLVGLNVAGTLDGIVEGPADFNFDTRAVELDTAAESVDLGEMDLAVLGLAMAANVEPFSYAGSPRPVAELRVAEFSLKKLMQTLGIEPPVTADPDVMQRVSFSATATVSDEDVSLTAMALDFDDSAMTGSLSVPMTEVGALRFDLEVDSIVLDGYMAPADQGATNAGEESADMEIPADLIRTLHVNGNIRINQAFLAGMAFTNLELGANAAGGILRLNPLSADFYDGGYSGDVRIDASTDVPVISVDERISGVNVGAMTKAMYDIDNISGTINGRFRLQGAGKSVAAIQRDLDGEMSFGLENGAWEGTDVWYELRRARALYRQEPAPAPTLPARTEFTAVTATGPVADGVFTNKDFKAELPFLQLTGGGMVDLVSTEVNYSMQV